MPTAIELRIGAFRNASECATPNASRHNGSMLKQVVVTPASPPVSMYEQEVPPDTARSSVISSLIKLARATIAVKRPSPVTPYIII